MWIATGVFGLIVQWLPGTGTEHVELVYGLCLFALAWGAWSVFAGLRRWTMSLTLRAVVTALMMAVVALALWATGGATSYLLPVLLFTALFIGWFFPPRLAWPLVVLFLFTYASPLLYDADAVDTSFPARVLAFSVAVVGQTLAMQFLKLRLVRAELRQRGYAELDPLTAVSNRRGFDHALATTLRDIPSAPMAVVCLGFDGGALDRQLDGFGFLVPRGEGVRSLGALWDSSVYAGRADEDHALIRVMLGGARDANAPSLSDDELLGIARADLNTTMGLTTVPMFTRVIRHPIGIPQYTEGHLDRLARIEERLAAWPGLFVAGNGYRGVAINACVADALPLARKILRRAEIDRGQSPVRLEGGQSPH